MLSSSLMKSIKSLVQVAQVMVKALKVLADILKPALSRGELTVIGATTQDEYRNTILKNAALARRFNEVKVNAPSAEDTFKILQGIRASVRKAPQCRSCQMKF